MTTKTHAIATIHHATSAAHTELEHRGLPATAAAVKVIGSSTAAIGHHVRGWAGDVGGMMHGVLGHKKKRRSSGKGRRRKLTAKQIAAGFGGKRRRKHKGKGHATKKKAAHHHKGRRKLSAAQKRAGFGGKRSMHGKRRKRGKR